IGHRLRHAQFGKNEGARWLGTSIASLSALQGALVVGSNLRKDHPLFSLRVRAATRRGAKVAVIHDRDNDWAMNVAASQIVPASDGLKGLAAVAAAVGAEQGCTPRVAGTASW